MMFNKELLADLLQQAKGDRSINRFGLETNVDPGYISRLLRCQVPTPPSAMVLAKIAGKASGEVTVEHLMSAAGYIPQSTGAGAGNRHGKPPAEHGVAGHQSDEHKADNYKAEERDQTGHFAAGHDTAEHIPAKHDAIEHGAAGHIPDDAGAPEFVGSPQEAADGDPVVDELLSFCKEMIERPLLLDAFKQIRNLGDEKLRRAVKMIRMIAEMGD